MQACFNVKRTIHVRIVDQTFPADSGSGFFKIDAHNDVQLIAQVSRQGFQTTGVVQRRIRIVDRTRPAHYQQAMIAPLQNVGDGVARGGDFIFVVGAKRELVLQLLRRDENLFCTDVYVIERVFLHDAIPVVWRYALKWNIERFRALPYHAM